MKRLSFWSVGWLLGANLTCFASPSFAQEPEAAVEESAAGEGGEESEKVIANWWSWDYGPTAKDPEHRHLPPPFGYALVNFAIFAALIYKLAADPLKKFVRGRHEQIGAGVESAKQHQADATALLARAEADLAKLESETKSIIEAMQREANSEKERIVAQAQAQADRIRKDAEQQIQGDLLVAREALRRELVDTATRLAETMVRGATNEADEARFVEQLVAKVETERRPA